MHLTGIALSGLSNQGISPLDFSGLKAWYRATDGIETVTSYKRVSGWRDLSGGGLHLNSSGGGEISETVNGPGYTSFSGTPEPLTCKVNPPAFNCFINGSPCLIIQVYTNTTAFGDNGGISINNTAPRLDWSVQQNSNRPFRLTGLKTSMDTFGASANQKMLAYFVNYGYQSGIINPARLYYNGVLRSKAEYASNPSALIINSSQSLAIKAAQGKFLHELICYDQTGKTPAQMDAELQQLVQIYLNVRYPNPWVG